MKSLKNFLTSVGIGGTTLVVAVGLVVVNIAVYAVIAAAIVYAGVLVLRATGVL